MARADTVYKKVKVSEIKSFSPKAIWVLMADGEEVGFPFSQLEGGEEKVRASFKKGDKNVLLSASDWILAQKNIEV